MINSKIKELLLASAIFAVIVACFMTFLPQLLSYLFISFSLFVAFIISEKKYVSRALLMLLLFFSISVIYHEFGFGHFDNYKEILYTYTVTLTSLFLSTKIGQLSRRRINLLFVVFVICFCIGLIYTIYVGLIDPMVVRSAFSDNTGELKRGIFSYSIMHVLPCISVFFTCCCLYFRQFILKLLFGVFALLSVFALARLVITTSLLTSILAIVLMVCYYYSAAKVSRTLFVLVTLGMIFLIVAPILLNSWIETTDNIELATKIESLMDTASSGEAEGQVEGRQTRYLKSIVNIENVLLGLTSRNNTGNHSFFLDMWAFYGILSLLFFVSWYQAISYILNKMNNKFNKSAYMISLLPILLLVFLKSMVFWVSYFVMSLVILPLCFRWLDLHADKNDLTLKKLRK